MGTSRTGSVRKVVLLLAVWACFLPLGAAQTRGLVSETILLRILKAEDTRTWDAETADLLRHPSAAVRRRAALAAGRIGDPGSVPALNELLLNDPDPDVRSMAAFALGETESEPAVRALLEALRLNPLAAIRARIVEGIGKCAGALPAADDLLKQLIARAILGTLEQENKRLPQSEREVVLAALTAAIRARPANAGRPIAMFLYSPDARVRADAANALARLRLKDANEALRNALSTDPDPDARANAARALAAAEDANAVALLLEAAVRDPEPRVRVTAIRALAAFRDPQIEPVLLRRGLQLRSGENSSRPPHNIHEELEIATTLGRVASPGSPPVADYLRRLHADMKWSASETAMALARVSPRLFVQDLLGAAASAPAKAAGEQLKWNHLATLARGIGELARVAATTTFAEDKAAAEAALRFLREHLPSAPPLALPELLRALAAFKPPDLRSVLLAHLRHQDVIVRAATAELLAETPADDEARRALVEALVFALKDSENDAALAILDALAKHGTPEATAAIRGAASTPDYIVRRRALALLRAAGHADPNLRAEPVQSRLTMADYRRSIARMNKTVTATVETSRGTFTIELLPREAPLTVDNFIQLARKGFFNGLYFHRVVPNFVIQDGDPRGDGTSAPGWQIRCEINLVPYERGTVGMALSGKDTGGSQWFVTHSPQPHLDGGYTVFGRVTAGLDVVDRIARGDRILRIAIRETSRPQAGD
jgi:cyclophilin family peptidyl-prolyl cis-trans isomerase/HEAT repeat protein